MSKARKVSLPARACVALIWCYKKFLSPVFSLLPGGGCRFYPTCSQYAKTAYIKHGFIKGSLMSFFRILRCNPFCEGGIDFVPENFSFRGLFRRNIPENNKVDEPRK